MKYFNSPFAASGDKIDIPNANQADGSVSFVQGFGFDYERENTDPNYKPVPREQTNSLYHDITEALQYVQSGRSFPYNQDFANAIGGYGKGSLVSIESDLSVVYKSKVDNNLTPPPSANWEVAGTVAQATESVAGIAKIATQAKVNAGTDDLDFVTSKKLGDLIESLSTVIYPGGTKASPAAIPTVTRIVTPNPYPGYHVYCQAEILLLGKWGATSWHYSSANSGSYGVFSTEYGASAEDIVTQSGSYLVGSSTAGGDPFTESVNISSAPFRIKVIRGNKI